MGMLAGDDPALTIGQPGSYSFVPSDNHMNSHMNSASELRVRFLRVGAQNRVPLGATFLRVRRVSAVMASQE